MTRKGDSAETAVQIQKVSAEVIEAVDDIRNEADANEEIANQLDSEVNKFKL